MNRYRVLSVLDENGYNITHKSEFKKDFTIETSVYSDFLNPYEILEIFISTVDKSKCWRAFSYNVHSSREICSETGKEKRLYVIKTENNYFFRLIEK